MIRIPRPHVVLAMILAAALAGCGQSSGTGGGTSGPPRSGTITGRVVSYRSQDKNHTQPLAGVKVLAYTRAFPVVGPVMADGPKPVAHTTSGSDGGFVLAGLEPGRYFVVAQSSAHWVRLSPWAGAHLTIAVCSDCPLPL